MEKGYEDGEREPNLPLIRNKPNILPPLQRQFERLMEMLILRTLDPMDEKANQAYRLQVNQLVQTVN
jgi:hypothetical protein